MIFLLWLQGTCRVAAETDLWDFQSSVWLCITQKVTYYVFIKKRKSLMSLPALKCNYSAMLYPHETPWPCLTLSCSQSWLSKCKEMPPVLLIYRASLGSPISFFVLMSMNTPQGSFLKCSCILFYNDCLSQIVRALWYSEDTGLSVSFPPQYCHLQRVFSSWCLLSSYKYVSLPPLFNQ